MESAIPPPVYVGIDVAKGRLDVHLLPSGETLVLPNDDAGPPRLATFLAGLRPVLVVLEATGGYEVRLAAELASAGVPVAVVNPRQIRDFARATGRLAKTDRVDAAVIALFAERIRPAPRPLQDAETQALGELVARRRQVVEMVVIAPRRVPHRRRRRVGRPSAPATRSAAAPPRAGRTRPPPRRAPPARSGA